MASIKPATPKGTRDFGPEQSAKRTYIIETIRRNFIKYGFRQLETPAMENLSTLTGKYGDEGDQLLFKILNSGDFLSKTPEDKRSSSGEILPYIAEKGLRYDLTVPFARYVSTHQHELAMPFKRFQIQPVWRADRPQKGRYREFYQCDADIIGTSSIWNEVELSLLIHDVFADLGFDGFSLKVNHREILNCLAASCGLKGKEIPFCVELDKLDKTSPESVTEQMVALGANAEAVGHIMAFINEQIDWRQKIGRLESEFDLKDTSVRQYFEHLEAAQRSLNIDFDLSLARGLTYYTGMVFEVKPTTVQMGSITGGGRYDNLTGMFGLPGVSGVGISFGLDRIYDVLEELGLFPESLLESVKVFIVHMDRPCFDRGIQLLLALRKAGISADIYPEEAKFKKQFAYADKIQCAYTLVIGSDELTSGQYNLKNMKSGEQAQLDIDAIIAKLLQG